MSKYPPCNNDCEHCERPPKKCHGGDKRKAYDRKEFLRKSKHKDVGELPMTHGHKKNRMTMI